MNRNSILLFAALAVLCFVPGSLAQGQAAAQASQRSVAPAIVIGPGDVVDIEVFDTPELSLPSARVSQSGSVNLPVLGVVQIAGLTADQAARRIESQLKSRGIMLQPDVTVSFIEYATQGATILGAIKTPGVYPTFGNRRLLDLIALAGGVAPSAGKVVTIAHRTDPTHPETIHLVARAQGLGHQQNPIILPGDTIVVARAGIVYILGAVKKPGGFLIDNNERITLLQALSLAGGWEQTASLSKAKLIRKMPGGHEQLVLDLKHVLRGKQADVSMSDGDILYVPTSHGKTLAYKGMDAVIAAAQTAVVYDSGNGSF